MLPTGLKQLVLEKQQADELAAALARERAKEDAEFAAAEAAAAALEWEKVYVVRTEREEAVKRAEEAEEKLRKVAHDAAMRSANWHFPFSQSKADEQVWWLHRLAQEAKDKEQRERLAAAALAQQEKQAAEKQERHKDLRASAGTRATCNSVCCPSH